MHHQDVVLPGQGDDALEELEVHAARRRIAREAENHHFRLRNRLADGALHLLDEVDIRRHAYRANVRAGDDRPIDVNRVRRVGHQDGIATIQGGQHQMRETFLRADGHHRFAVRVESDVVAPLIPVANRSAQAWNPLGDRIAMRVLAQRRLDQLVGDVLRRRAVRVAHAHVDDVLTAPACGHLQLGGDAEDVGGQTFDAGKLSHDSRLGKWSTAAIDRSWHNASIDTRRSGASSRCHPLNAIGKKAIIYFNAMCTAIFMKLQLDKPMA
jgi:hypothetical protein